MQKRQLKPYHGIIFFVLTMLALTYINPYMQLHWGMWGLAAIEVLLLGMALLYVRLLGADMRQVFPIGKIQVAPFFGTLLMWGAMYLITQVATMALFVLFPRQMTATGQGINESISGIALPLAFLFVAVLPAVCEEVVTRGVIQNSFQFIRSKWLIILLVAACFGAMHRSAWRFLPTALLGGALAYIMYETGNLLYAMLFHFCQNGFILFFSAMTSEASRQAGAELLKSPYMMLTSLAVYMIMTCVAPFLLYTGAYLIRLGKAGERPVSYLPPKGKGTTLAVLISLTVLLAVGGLILFGYCLFHGALELAAI